MAPPQLTIKASHSTVSGRAVLDALVRSGIAEHLEHEAHGPFGHTSLTLGLLESLAEAATLGIAAAEGLRGVILEELSADASGASFASFVQPRLQPEHRLLVSCFQLVVTVDDLLDRISRLYALPQVQGDLELEGLRTY